MPAKIPARAFVAAWVAALLSSNAAAAIVIPITSGEATGSTFFNFAAATDAQPSEIPTEGAVVGASLGSSPAAFFTSTQGYIDFGVGYANIEIIEVWTAFLPYSIYDGNAPFTSLWWSPSIDNTFDVGTDVMENLFNFAAKPLDGLPSSVIWTRDLNVALDLFPRNRYLIVDWTSESGGWGGGWVTEILIVGNIIPEPSVAALLLGFAGALGSRRFPVRRSRE